ncbi:hypothetical protein CYMTET_15557 [Cymbomonas tetramitiformis]|uniref:Uncharacterized protein n=1 Tax=Cymbomonas tetramitiformis TaxID=36881 RepID=A0AAE0GDS3_9CHLO|nr:hypothetical protein CYMTET_15557 [Cymbomonas tetramitiformis]
MNLLDPDVEECVCVKTTRGAMFLARRSLDRLPQRSIVGFVKSVGENQRAKRKVITEFKENRDYTLVIHDVLYTHSFDEDEEFLAWLDVENTQAAGREAANPEVAEVEMPTEREARIHGSEQPDVSETIESCKMTTVLVVTSSDDDSDPRSKEEAPRRKKARVG